jgi:hypothetical protein
MDAMSFVAGLTAAGFPLSTEVVCSKILSLEPVPLAEV